MTNLEQHFICDVKPFQNVLDTVNINGRHVIEFGAGTGVLTQLLLDCGARVTAYEIEPGLCRIVHPDLVLIEDDIRNAKIPNAGDAFISAPPYSQLRFINAWVESNGISDSIMLVPFQKLSSFSGYTIEAKLSGLLFSPPSTGEHVIIKKGFNHV